MTAVPRVGGRVLLIDPDGRVLLIHERIDNGRTHWLTPGGGVEPGESPAHAAVREVFEETGIRVELAEDASSVLVTRRLWSWRGVTYDQVDHFFATPVGRDVEVLPQRLTSMEHETLISHRWWTAADLRETSESIVPAELATVLARLATSGA